MTGRSIDLNKFKEAFRRKLIRDSNLRGPAVNIDLLIDHICIDLSATITSELMYESNLVNDIYDNPAKIMVEVDEKRQRIIFRS